jgi:hypothetical protein
MGLSSNYALPWSEALIEKYQERWEFNATHGLCSNIDLPWSLNLIKKYADRWDYNYLSINGGVWTKVFEPVVDNSFVEEFYTNL